MSSSEPEDYLQRIIRQNLGDTGLNAASVSIETHFDARIIHSVTPDPNFLYRRETVQVRCDECGREFPDTELKSDSYEYEDGDTYSDTICPHCGTWECCELEFERLGDWQLAEIAKANE